MVFWESTVVFWLIQWIFLVEFTVLCLANIVVFLAKKSGNLCKYSSILGNTVVFWPKQFYFGANTVVFWLNFLKTNNVVFCGKKGYFGQIQWCLCKIRWYLKKIQLYLEQKIWGKK